MTYTLVAGVSWNTPNQRCANNTRLAYDPAVGATYCAIPPKIQNIKLGDGTSNTVKLGTDGGKVKLSFNTIVDSQQQPLKRFYIDWGDSTIDSPLFGYKAKDDPNNPHVFSHAYDNCNNCTYIIKILAEDNWGWCSAQPEGGAGNIFGIARTCEDISKDVTTKPRWDPVDSNACSGGSCINGVCTGGADNGRSCGELRVELKD
jgi:hypothetical protein